MAYRPLLLTTPMMRGPDVTALQKVIAAYDPAPGGAPFVDGVFGPNTRDALVAWQRANMLTRNLGVAMPDLQAQLRLPVPVNAVAAPPSLDVGSTMSPGAGLVPEATPATVRGAGPNWRLWLSLAGLGVVGYLATRKKGWF